MHTLLFSMGQSKFLPIGLILVPTCYLPIFLVFLFKDFLKLALLGKKIMAMWSHLVVLIMNTCIDEILMTIFGTRIKQ